MTSQAEAMSLAGRTANLTELEELLARARELGAPDHARVYASVNTNGTLAVTVDVRIPDKKNGAKNDDQEA